MLYEVITWDRTNDQPLTWISDKRLILVTDLGLLVKNNADQSRDLFVMSVKTGRPVPGAKVVLQGRNGLPLLTRITDSYNFV